ncbi:hypothetical protein [Teichococcus aestuarii]|uniref:hypothetical protein n=1 Tax=Teichococcus aestuarii TaxID=568898 RepID=UPI00361802BA
MRRIAEALVAGGHPPERFRAAVLRQLARQDRALIAGLAAYRRHPAQREMPSLPVLWQEGRPACSTMAARARRCWWCPPWSTAPM